MSVDRLMSYTRKSLLFGEAAFWFAQNKVASVKIVQVAKERKIACHGQSFVARSNVSVQTRSFISLKNCKKVAYYPKTPMRSKNHIINSNYWLKADNAGLAIVIYKFNKWPFLRWSHRLKIYYHCVNNE